MSFHSSIFNVFLFAVISTLFFSGAALSDSPNTSSMPQRQNTPDSLIQPNIQTLRGKLIYEDIPPVMSLRAYRREKFFLISNSGSTHHLVLRPSKAVDYKQLQSFHNQQVEITALYVQGTRPSAEIACPVDSDGQCLPQGEGYQVLSIKASPMP